MTDPARELVRPAVTDRLQLAPLGAVELEGLLGQRVAANATHRLPRIPDRLLLDGFAERPLDYWTGERTGKWIDAAALAWMHAGDPELRSKLDRVVAGVVASQLEDGYLGTALAADRWQEWDVWIHKYVLLGLLRYHQATGDGAALEAARRAADLILDTFGPGRRSILTAGAHMGMAATSILEPMVLLYRRTGDRRYLDFSQHLVASWDQEGGPRILTSLEETGSVLRTANAKAYEMISNLIGLCELYRTTGEQRLLDAVLVAWQDIHDHQLYVTGGAAVGEYFAEPGELPNHAGDRINENCVTVSWLQLNAQLLRLTGEARYADALEHSYYNALLAAQSDDGSEWCYYTPLLGTKPFTAAVHCCSSNGPRALGLAPSLAFAQDQEGVAVVLYEPSRGELVTPAGRRLALELSGGYPGSGRIALTLALDHAESFALRLRIPAWATSASVSAGGGLDSRPVPGSWLVLEREWRDGDRLDLELDLSPRLVAGSGTDSGRLAAMAGPLVLALDTRDNPGVLPPDAAGYAASSWSERPPRLEPVPPDRAAWPGQARALAEGFVVTRGGRGRPATLTLRDYATAGDDGSPFAVWLRAPGELEPDAWSLLYGAPGRSSAGSPASDTYLSICPYCPVGLLAMILNDRRPLSTLGGSGEIQTALTDDDPKSLAVAFAAEDGRAWFEVRSADMVEARRIEVVHGTTNLDGGWFDTSGAKPTVEVREGGGDWIRVGSLNDYPDTTAASAPGLAPGSLFALDLGRPRRLSGVRVAGSPSRGERSRPARVQGRAVPDHWRSHESFVTVGEIRVR